MTVDDPYCFFVFKNVYIERYNRGQVKTSACCYNATGQTSSKIDFLGDAHLSQQRFEMRQGQRPKGCASCWNKESAETFSYRQIVNHDAAYFTGDPYKIELLGIDYNVSPICNAKCIMCSGLFSSSWAAEDKKFGKTPDIVRDYGEVRHNQLHQDLDLSALNRIYFNGGEPLLSDEPLQILKDIETQQNGLHNLDVSLNSNGSIFPAEEILEMWARCKSVKLNLSIDACADAFEYIRYPLSWHAVQDVVNRLIAMHIPSLRFTIAATVGVYNFLELDALRNWVDALNRLQPQTPIELVLQPAYGELGLYNASDKFKTKVKSTLAAGEVGERVLSFLDSPRDSWANEASWLLKLQELDRRRDQYWQKSLPRLAQFIDSIENPAPI